MADSKTLTSKLIRANEVADGDLTKIQQGYERLASRPHLPPKSGITLGFGYDLGQQTMADFEEDWKGVLTPEQIQRLKPYTKDAPTRPKKPIKATTPVPYKEAATAAAVTATRDILIRHDDAARVFEDKILPKYRARAMKRFPGLEHMSPEVQAAVIDRVYARGEYADPKKEPLKAKLYFEIEQAIIRRSTYEVYGVLKKMRSLHTLKNLVNRSDRSAKLVGDTLPKINSTSFATPGVNYTMPATPPGVAHFGPR